MRRRDRRGSPRAHPRAGGSRSRSRRPSPRRATRSRARPSSARAGRASSRRSDAGPRSGPGAPPSTARSARRSSRGTRPGRRRRGVRACREDRPVRPGAARRRPARSPSTPGRRGSVRCVVLCSSSLLCSLLSAAIACWVAAAFFRGSAASEDIVGARERQSSSAGKLFVSVVSGLPARAISARQILCKPCKANGVAPNARTTLTRDVLCLAGRATRLAHADRRDRRDGAAPDRAHGAPVPLGRPGEPGRARAIEAGVAHQRRSHRRRLRSRGVPRLRRVPAAAPAATRRWPIVSPTAGTVGARARSSRAWSRRSTSSVRRQPQSVAQRWARDEGDATTIAQLDPVARTLRPADWPPELAALEALLERAGPRRSAAGPMRRPG